MFDFKTKDNARLEDKVFNIGLVHSAAIVSNFHQDNTTERLVLDIARNKMKEMF